MVSLCVTPSKTSSPGSSIAPTTSSETVTRARVTRVTTAFTAAVGTAPMVAFLAAVPMFASEGSQPARP